MIGFFNNILNFNDLYICPWDKMINVMKKCEKLNMSYKIQSDSDKEYDIYIELNIDGKDVRVYFNMNQELKELSPIHHLIISDTVFADMDINKSRAFTELSDKDYEFRYGKMIEKDNKVFIFYVNAERDRDLAMYILVNSDIELSKGKLGGQIGHAVFDYVYSHKSKEDEELFKEYMEKCEEVKILLACPEKLLKKYEAQGYTAVRDNGRTELTPNTLTCVNIGIVDRKTFDDKKIKRLRLYK